MTDPRLVDRLACARAKRIVELEAELAAARERETKLRKALRERDYALRRIATTGDEVSNPAEWMRGIARSALADGEGET